jgi:Flp pilus assembly protein TadD
MGDISIEQTMTLAIQHHQAGRLQEAEQLYRQILARQPGHVMAMHHLGMIAHQVGRNDIAVDLLRRVITLNPNLPEAHSNFGNVLRIEGQLDEAIAACRQAIALRPNYAEAHNNLGLALKDKGQPDEAIAAYHQAIALKPNYAEAHNNLGIALMDKGQLDEATAACRRAIKLKPNYAEAHNNLGNSFQIKGQTEEAIAAYRQAIALRPNYAKAVGNLGKVLKEKGKLDEAIAAYRQAIVLNPNYAETHNNLGIALTDKGQLDEAIAAYRQAIKLKPNFAEAHNNLGFSLRDKGQHEEAMVACRQAITLKPRFPEAHSNLGNALRDKGLLDEAIVAYRQAIMLRPGFSEAMSNLGNALRDNGQLEEAVDSYRRAIALKPDLADAHYNLALTLLLCGDFQPGWEEHEWRWKCTNFPSARRNFSQSQWNGGALETCTLLLHTEQGLGDAIQFIRYLPLVVQRGGKIIVECRAELQRLLRTMHEKCKILARGEPLPAFDLHCPLLSLPLVFGTMLDNIPKTVPYLHADMQDAKKWQERMDGQLPIVKVVKVGLVWAGKLKPDPNRSMKLSSLAPLGQVPGVRFFSLQKGTAAAEAKTPPTGMELVDWTSELKDFADTAALIANLDLVISIDTSVAHLAGAMGKPVWTLLPFNSDWRWLLERQDSPWYPTMRLFRQETPGDWQTPIQKLTEELSRFATIK